MGLRVGSAMLSVLLIVASVGAQESVRGPAPGKRMAVINFSDANEDSGNGTVDEVTTVSVSTLTSRRRDEAWLGKAIADLLHPGSF